MRRVAASYRVEMDRADAIREAERVALRRVCRSLEALRDRLLDIQLQIDCTPATGLTTAEDREYAGQLAEVLRDHLIASPPVDGARVMAEVQAGDVGDVWPDVTDRVRRVLWRVMR